VADKKQHILLDHGGGGQLSHELISGLMLPAFRNDILAQLNDGALLDIGANRLAFSTDTYVVDPVFFPGGDIGELAVNGTVNDIAMCGAVPLFLSAGLVVEEGFAMADLEKILASMGRAADAAGVKVVTGDTKVVPRGVADKIFINTSGIGQIHAGVNLSAEKARAGDCVILSGSIADHGMTILLQREEMAFEARLQSDTAPLNFLVARMLAASGEIHVLRDPTRGGVGSALNEIAVQSQVGIRIHEDRIAVKPAVAGVCDLLGFEPLYVANEGKLLAFVAAPHAEKVLAAMHEDPCGRDAAVIGEVVAENPGTVVMETRIGGSRIVPMLTGEQLPRIC